MMFECSSLRSSWFVKRCSLFKLKTGINAAVFVVHEIETLTLHCSR